jgi:hypothetical protein
MFSYSAQQTNPYLQNLTMKSNFKPLIDASHTAEAARLGANTTATQQGVYGLNAASSALTAGNTNSIPYRNPYISTGSQALGRANEYAGAMTPASYAAMIANDPVLQSINTEGMRAMQTQAANNGMQGSGAFMLDLARMAQDNSNKYIGDIFNRNYQLAGMGQTSAENQAGQEYNLGQNQAAIQSDMGELNATSTLARGEINANEAVNRALAEVAQSTASGLSPGQIASSFSGGLAQHVDDGQSWAEKLAENNALYSRDLNKPQQGYTISGSGASGGTSAAGGSSSNPYTTSSSEPESTAGMGGVVKAGQDIVSGAMNTGTSTSAGASMGDNWGSYGNSITSTLSSNPGSSVTNSYVNGNMLVRVIRDAAGKIIKQVSTPLSTMAKNVAGGLVSGAMGA